MITLPRSWLIGIAGSMFVHVMCARAALQPEAPRTVPPPPPMDVQMIVRETPPPPPPPEAPKPRAVAATAKSAPARAGRVMDAAPNAAPDTSPVDFSIVQGSAGAYVGGITAASGTSDTPVREIVKPAPVATAAAEVPVVPASPSGSEWDCSSLYPAEASADESATVLVKVRVDKRGKPSTVTVMRDPGHGFAAAARACALAQTYQPARDKRGEPVAGDTPAFVIRFHR